MAHLHPRSDEDDGLCIRRPVPQDAAHPCFLYLACRQPADCVVIETDHLLHLFLDSARFDRPLDTPARQLAPACKIVQVPGKGLGLVADGPIEAGTLIASEPPLLLGPNKHKVSSAMFPRRSGAFEAAAIGGLCPSSREAFRSLSNAYSELGALGIVETNSLVITLPGQPPGTVYSAVFPTISRANHSCRPNVNVFFDFEAFEGQLYAMTPIAAGDEISLSYILVEASRAQRRAQLSSSYKFACSCGACRLDGDELVGSNRRRSYLGEVLDASDASDAEVDLARIDVAIGYAKTEGLVEAEAFLWYHGAKHSATSGHASEASRRAAVAGTIFRTIEGSKSVWAARSTQLS